MLARPGSPLRASRIEKRIRFCGCAGLWFVEMRRPSRAALAEFPDRNAELLALSARLAEMPEPGKAMSPIGRTASIWSLRLKGAALAWRVQSGLNAICGTLRWSAQRAAMRSAPFGDPPCSSTMSGCWAWTLSSLSQIKR